MGAQELAVASYHLSFSADGTPSLSSALALRGTSGDFLYSREEAVEGAAAT